MRKKPPFSASRSAPKGGFFRIAPPETPGMERCGRSRLFQHRGVLRRRWERQNVECSTNQSSRSCPLMQRYAVIGNLHTVALVGKNGSIDWCCIPRFDAPSVFGALLDAEKGGFFRIVPSRVSQGERCGRSRLLEHSSMLKKAASSASLPLRHPGWNANNSIYRIPI